MHRLQMYLLLRFLWWATSKHLSRRRTRDLRVRRECIYRVCYDSWNRFLTLPYVQDNSEITIWYHRASECAAFTCKRGSVWVFRVLFYVLLERYCLLINNYHRFDKSPNLGKTKTLPNYNIMDKLVYEQRRKLCKITNEAYLGINHWLQTMTWVFSTNKTMLTLLLLSF